MRAAIAAVLCAVALAGCEPDRNQQVAADQPQGREIGTTYYYNGMIEGCRLYAVYPSYGDKFQLAICGNKGTTVTQWSETCGKGCTRRRESRAIVD